MNPSESQTQISAQDLMALGVNNVAYAKPVEVEGAPLFAVHAADGTQMAMFKSREVAEATLRRHDLELLSVH